MKMLLPPLLRGSLIVITTTLLSWVEASGADRTPLSAMTTIRSVGTYDYAASGMTVTLTEPSPGALTVRYQHQKSPNSLTASTLDPIKVDAEKWLVVFVAPYEVWVYDGFDKVILNERTAKGFKVTSSDVKPSLLKRTPPPIAAALTTRHAKS